MWTLKSLQYPVILWLPRNSFPLHKNLQRMFKKDQRIESFQIDNKTIPRVQCYSHFFNNIPKLPDYEIKI